jgi:hypothetical protein
MRTRHICPTPETEEEPMNDPTPDELSEEVRDARALIIEAMEFSFTEFGWGKPGKDELDRMAIDTDFTNDLRNLLIDFQDDDFDLARWLTTTDSTRYLELRRAYEILKWMATPDSYMTDELSKLYMENSLCPIHRVDWAICFDDEDPSCAQVRAIFPDGHDT